MSAIRPGLCSVTLRRLPIDAVAQLADECGLRSIEWGTDVHVPPGDVQAAVRARTATAAADCVVASVGSYLFSAGLPDLGDTQRLLDTAVALGAPNIRVWTTFGVDPESSAHAIVVDGLRAFCTAAGTRGLTVGLEYHGGTAAATVAGTLGVLEAVDRPELYTYWQPPYWQGPTAPESDAIEVRALGARLSHLHVYEWASAQDRRPLGDGADRWRAVLDAAATVDGTWTGDRVAFIEFVPDDDPDALRRDAAVLHGWLDDQPPPTALVG